MSRNADALPGRTESLIPLSRKARRSDWRFTPTPIVPTIAHAIPVGRMLEDIGAVFFRGAMPL